MPAVVEFDLSLECFSVHIITGWVESSFLRHTRGDMHGQYFNLGYTMLKVCDVCKDGLDTDKDGSSISTKWGCAHPISC